MPELPEVETIVLELNESSLIGKFLFDLPPCHERVRLYLEDGRILYYADQRKFGRFSLVRALELTKNVGVDPFSKAFTLDLLQSFLGSHSRQIKHFLLDQKYISGLGNIYVDEALWEAKINPKRLCDSLSEQEIQGLYGAIPKVLEKGLKNRGTSLGDRQANYFSVSGRRGGNQYQLNVFRRDGEPCFRCGEAIIKLRAAQRGTHMCPVCQI